jgi:hypothetical protein
VSVRWWFEEAATFAQNVFKKEKKVDIFSS